MPSLLSRVIEPVVVLLIKVVDDGGTDLFLNIEHFLGNP